jgi:excisionase family DNA binding protein
MQADVMGISEAAIHLSVSRKWIYELVGSGQLKAEKHNGKWEIQKSEVIRRRKIMAQVDKLRAS